MTWRDWHGGKLPARQRETPVQVRFRCGHESRVYKAGDLLWKWADEPLPFDIIAYRKADNEAQ